MSVLALPQLAGRPMVTDGGMETDLIFHHGVDLPLFAAFPLIDSPGGRSLLTDYYDEYAAIARRAGAGLMLESATWRANPDWGDRLGYGRADRRPAPSPRKRYAGCPAASSLAEAITAGRRRGQPGVLPGQLVRHRGARGGSPGANRAPGEGRIYGVRDTDASTRSHADAGRGRRPGSARATSGCWPAQPGRRLAGDLPSPGHRWADAAGRTHGRRARPCWEDYRRGHLRQRALAQPATGHSGNVACQRGPAS